MDDYFQVFGLGRRLELDTDGLQRRFYELSRAHHPDFHQAAPAGAQAEALATSALVNRAYRALRDPLSRVEYLVALEEGRETREGAEAQGKVPMELLEEMMTVQEALQDARAAGLDESARRGLEEEHQRLTERRQGEEAAIVGRFAEWDRAVDGDGDRAKLIAWFKERLATRAYLRTVIDDLGEALGAGEERDVSHRRH